MLVMSTTRVMSQLPRLRLKAVEPVNIRTILTTLLVSQLLRS
ncbi:unannotated protein [freshwater metagenome]|uniref:Unannotated protein n=1 Tax=freshwater metagenome TaxID=449393 RepID=A0A6J7LHF9_9ZZZZ